MSKKPIVRQHDSAFTKHVRGELEGARPDSNEEIVLSALRCAALAVLARPETHEKLMRRLRSLLQTTLDRATLGDLMRFVSRCRSLFYDEGQETHLTVSEAARRLGVARSTIYRWLGDPEMFLSPVHDDPDLGPDRIPFATFQQMRKRAAEKNEADVLRKALETDLPYYEKRIRDEITERLDERNAQLVVQDIQRMARSLRIEVSDATIRRWPAHSIDRSMRGRPRKVYSIETVAPLLAKRARRQRAKTIRSASTPLQTLRRLKNEIPVLTKGTISGDSARP